MSTPAPQESSSSDRPGLQAWLLGDLRLLYQDRQILAGAFRRRRSLILLTALLLAPGRQLPRDVLMERLWPDGDPGATADNLNTVVSALRAVLDSESRFAVIQRRGGIIALAPEMPVDIDVTAFEEAASAALESAERTALLAAAALYRGPLLPGLPYEDWVERRRETLARLHRRVLTALAAVEAASDPDVAEERLHVLLTTEPTNETAARRLMRLLGARGHRAEALRVYERLSRALHDELDLSPSQKTQELYTAFREQQWEAAEPVATEAETTPPPSPAAARHNLVRQMDAFIGRGQAQSEVVDLLGRAMLVTLTGSGGVGKTRLALAVAEQLLGAYPDGIWMVELAPLAQAALLPAAVAHAIGLSAETGRDPMAKLVDQLRDRRMLLVLDNCEHLVAACAGLASTLLRASAHMKILATSREALSVAGEVCYRVPSLSVPDPQAPPPLELIPAYEAVRLFVTRAQAIRQDFALNEQNAAAVAAICVRLDGIPLAIELAAARVGALSVAEIAGRLNDRFRLLTGGPRNALPRQQTLQATLDWSWALLGEPERTLLRRLSVFSNGWSLPAAEAVCSSEDLPALAVLDMLAALTAKSLVQFVDHPEGSRYSFLETVQQYARDRLIAAGEEVGRQDRHLRWSIAFAEEAAPGLLGADQAAWLARLDREHDNLRTALTWARGRGTREEGLRLSGALWRFWALRGYHSEGREWLESALAGDSTAFPAAHATALNGAGNLAWQQGDYARATILHEEALALRRALDDTRGIAGSLANLGTVAYRQGNYRRASTLYEESLVQLRLLEDQWGIAGALNNLAMVAFQRGDFTRAATLYEEGLALQRALHDEKGASGSLDNLGLVMSRMGNHQRAIALQEEALVMQRSLGYNWGAAITLGNLGMVLARQGDMLRAAELQQESLELLRQIGDRHSLAASLSNLGEVATMQGDFERALALYAESMALQRRMGDTHGSARSLIHLGTVAYLQGSYERAAGLFTEGLLLSQEIGARDQLAEGLEGLAWVAALSERAQRAARLGGAAHVLREELDVPLQMGRQAQHDQAVESMRAVLDEPAFSAAWAAGQNMPLDEALAYALKEDAAVSLDAHVQSP